MSIDEILAALQAIIDGAGDQPLSDDQAARYEELEKDLAVARRNVEIRSRQNAYTTPVSGAHIHVAAVKPDDGLERAFNHYLRTGQANQDIAELRAQGEGTSTGGGYTVPPGFRDKLVEVVKAFGGLANEVESFSTSTGNDIEYPTLDDTANQGAITAESAAVADGADLVFGSVSLGAYKYTSAGAGTTTPLRVSVELLQDSAFDIQSLIARKLGERIARKQAAHWCTGTGVGEPKGIVASSLTANETADATTVFDYDDMLDTLGQLDPAYADNAKWVMNNATWIGIRGLLDTANRPLIYDQASSGIAGRPEKTLIGYPVVIDQAMPNNTGTNYFAILGDLKEAYVIRRVADFTLIVNPWTRAANGEVEYSGWERADGNIQNRNAYVIIKNS